MKKYLLSISILFIIFSSIVIAGCTQPVSQSTNQSWATYVDKSDGIKISYPSDWTVIVSKVSPSITSNPSITMEDNIHIYTPDANGVVQITGFGYPTELQQYPGLPDDVYEEFIKGFSKEQESVKSINVFRDDELYMINGNPARHLQLSFYIDKQQMASDVYIIRNNDVYYAVSYMVMDPSAMQYSPTATTIIETFKTVSWKA
jgi:hypothetical protein